MHPRLVEQEQILRSRLQQTHHAAQAAATSKTRDYSREWFTTVSAFGGQLRRYIVLMIAKWCVISAYGLTRNSCHFREAMDQWFPIRESLSRRLRGRFLPSSDENSARIAPERLIYRLLIERPASFPFQRIIRAVKTEVESRVARGLGESGRWISGIVGRTTPEARHIDPRTVLHEFVTPSWETPTSCSVASTWKSVTRVSSIPTWATRSRDFSVPREAMRFWKKSAASLSESREKCWKFSRGLSRGRSFTSASIKYPRGWEEKGELTCSPRYPRAGKSCDLCHGA